MRSVFSLAALLATAALASAQPPAPNAQMGKLLDALAELGPKPLETLTPQEARKQPGVGDAVKALLKKQGKPLTPEPVGNVEDVTFPGGDGKPLPMRVYSPEGDGPFPGLVYFHGGGFVIADLDTYDSSCRALCNAAKCIVASAEYRHAPENPTPAAGQDALAAYQFALANADKRNGDPKRVAVGGESAGGNLAAGVAIAAKQKGLPLPVYQLLVYPVTSTNTDSPSYRLNASAKPLNKAMMNWFFAHALNGQSGLVSDPAAFPLTAPNTVLAGLPGATVINAEIDPLLDDGVSYARKLEAAGVKVRAKVYKGVAHEFFGCGAVLDDAKEAVKFAAEGLSAAFGK